MVPDTTFTDRDVEMADTVITPSRWSYNGDSDAGAGDELNMLAEEVAVAMSDMGFEPAAAGRVARPTLEVPVLVASTPSAARPAVTPFPVGWMKRALG